MNTRIRTMRASGSSKSSRVAESHNASAATANRGCKPSIEKHLRASMLNNPPFMLAGLETQAREEVLSKCAVRRYAKGARIIREGERADGLYFIARGRAQVTRTSPDDIQVNFADLEQGEHFGEASLLDNRPHATAITALTDTKVFVMSRRIFRLMLGQHASIAFGLMQQLLATQHGLLERIAEFSTQSIGYRVRSESFRLAKRHQVLDGGARIPYMTHAKFAGHVSCSREAVTRELKSLERDGIVLKQKRQFVVPDIERLRKARDEAASKARRHHRTSNACAPDGEEDWASASDVSRDG